MNGLRTQAPGVPKAGTPRSGVCRRLRPLAALGAATLGLLTAAPAYAQSRVPWYQPFDGTSLWNTPIGGGATYSGPLGIGGGGDFADVDVEYPLRALPTDPSTPTGTYANSILFPYYALSNKGTGTSPNGTTSLIFFNADPNVNDYVIWQWQYWNRTNFGDPLSNVGNFQFGTFGTFNNIRPTYGGDDTAFGTHGGSELSALGGDLRVGEATSADPIRHALKLNIDGHYLYPTVPNHASGDRAGNGYRWPAYKADADPPPYGGSNPDLAQGSLLAIPPSVNINNLGLQTAFGKKIAWTLQNFGTYIVDNSGYTGDQLCLEQNAREEIAANYGAATYFAPNVSSDLVTLYQQLRVVTNNGSASIGGSGTRLTSEAPSLGAINNIPDGNYYIQNRGDGQALNVWNDSASSGGAVYQYPLVQGSGNEIFAVKHIGAGYYTITGQDSGLLLSIANTSQNDSALLEQDGIGTLPSGATGPADNQLWSFIPVDSSNGDYMLQVRHSGKVLDVPGSTTNNVQLQQYQANDSNAQRWHLVPVSSVGNGGETVLTSQTPATTGNNDAAYELGMKFKSDIAGSVTALRFWKDSRETGTHTGTLWDSSGNKLASVTFTGESASGWQQQALSSPVSISANTTYVVSVNTAGGYVDTQSGLASAITNQDLSSIADGNNGVYNTTPGSFPTASYNNSDYFRDVVFVPGNAGTTTDIAAGGAGVGSFVADKDYSGGSAYSTSDAINTSAANSAPAAVYQNERYGTFSYTVPVSTPPSGSSYTVRLHFAELYHGISGRGNDGGTGQRLFNVSINGSSVLSNFDIYATAGAADTAVVETFTGYQPNGSGNLVISFSPASGSPDQNAKVDGIEVFDPSGGKAAPAAPTGVKAVVRKGQVALSWAGVSGATSYTILRGTASGKEASYKSGVTGSWFGDTSVTKGTTYYYKVVSVNAKGQSAASTEVKATAQ